MFITLLFWRIDRKAFGCFGSITICPHVFVKLKFSVKGRFNPSFTVNVSCANVYDKYRPVVKKTPHTIVMTKAATFINQLSFRSFRSKIVGKAIDSAMHGAMINRNTPTFLICLMMCSISHFLNMTRRPIMSFIIQQVIE